MSVQTEITRISGAKSDIATAITNKGVTVPSGTKLDGMAALIDSIESGGGGSSGGSSAGFSVTFPAASGTNYANWSQFTAAYIIKVDGTLIDMTDYSTIAGKTIDNVLIMTAGNSDFYGLSFTFTGKILVFNPQNVRLGLNSVVVPLNDSTYNPKFSGSIHFNQFVIAASDITITSIKAYNTD